MIIAAADDMVLLRVSRGVHNKRHAHASPDSSSEYFVYQAGGATRRCFACSPISVIT